MDGNTWRQVRLTGRVLQTHNTTLNVINLQETTSYRAVYTNQVLCATAHSNVVTITVLELPIGTLSISAGNDTICAGTTTTIDLTVTNIEDGQTFTIYYVEGTSSKTKSFHKQLQVIRTRSLQEL